MQIGIQLGSISQYSMELDNEKAIEIYSQLLSFLINKSIEAKPAVIDVPLMKPELAEQKNEEKSSDKIEEAANNIVEEIVHANPFANKEGFQYKKLIAYKCPACGKITARFAVLKEDNVVNCHFCRNDNIVIETAEIADYKCTECNKRAYIWACNGLREILCKDCRTPIDLFNDPDGDGLKSNNLIKKHGCKKHKM